MALEEQKGLEQERKSLSRERETLKTEKSATRKSIERDVVDKDNYAQSAKQLQTANENYAQQLYLLGVSEKQIQSVTDNRNFFQKILNLKENQGIITGTMALLGRPAEALQGVLAASTQGGDVLKYAWEGLHGDKEYSLKDVGIDLGNPLMNAMANMAFEAGVDPLNFINIPWNKFFTKAADLAKGVNGKIAMWAGRTPEGQALYNAFQDKWIAATDFFKKIFGTWGDAKYKEFSNDMANASAQSIKDQNTYQLLLKENLTNLENLDQHIFERITGANGKEMLSQRDLEDLQDTLGLNSEVISNLRSTEASAVELGRTELFNSLSRYLSEKFESSFKHGWSMQDTLDNLLGDGIIEPAAKFVDDVYESNAYKIVEKALGWALESNPKYVNYELEDLVEVVEFSKARMHLGQVLKDAAGNPITTASLHQQGYIIRLTEEGKEVFGPYFAKIKANSLMQKAMAGAHMTKEQMMLQDLISNKALKLNTKDAESVAFVEEVKHLYKNITGQELMVYGRNMEAEGVYEVRFAPNKEVYDYAKQLNKQKLAIRKAKVRYDRVLRQHKKLQEPIIAFNTQIAEISKGIQQDLLLNQKQIFPTNMKEWDKITQELQDSIYGPLSDIMRERQKKNPDAIFMTEPVGEHGIKIAWGRGQQGFADWVNVMKTYADETGDTVLDLGGLKINRSGGQAKGSKYTLPVDIDFSKLNQTELVNVIGYCYTRGLIDGSDLAAAGIKNWGNLTTQAARGLLNKVITKRSFITLGQNLKMKDFINISEWITNDMIYTAEDIGVLAGDIWDNILAGRLTSDETIIEMASLFGQDTMWEWMYQHADNLTEMTGDRIEAVKVLQNERAKFQQALYDFEKANDVERIQILKDTMVSGVYQGDGRTEMGKVLEDLYTHYNIEDIDMELDTRIYWQEQASYDIIRQITRVDDDLAKAFQRTWNAKKYQPVAEFFGLGQKVTVDVTTIDDLKSIIQKGPSLKPIYACKTETGYITLSNVKPHGAPSDSYVVLDNTALTELYNYYEAFGKKRDLQKQLTLTNDNIVELQMIQHANRYPETKYNYETLDTILQEEYARWANEVNDTLLAQIKPNFQNQEVKDYVKQQETLVQESEKDLELAQKQIDSKMKSWQEEKSQLDAKHQAAVKKKETTLKTQKTKTSKKINEMNDKIKTWAKEDLELETKWKDTKKDIAAKEAEKKKILSEMRKEKVFNEVTQKNVRKYSNKEVAAKELELKKEIKSLWEKMDNERRGWTKSVEAHKEQAKELTDKQEQLQESLDKKQKEIDDLKAEQKKELDELLKKRDAELDELVNNKIKYQKTLAQGKANLDRLANKPQWFDTQDVQGLTDAVNEKAYVDGATFTDPLSQADLTAKNEQYIKPMLANVQLVKDLLSPDKSVRAYQNALKNLPDAFVAEVDRFINVQEALWANIASNFERTLNISMDGWNIKGYLRHMLTPEMASFSAIQHTLEEKYTGVMSQVFGKNMKKIALAREYQASAADVNRMMVDDLFNTNPIQVTAMALDILPENFLIGNTFKGMLDNKLIAEVSLAERQLDIKGLESLHKRLEDEWATLKKAKNPTPHQTIRMTEIEDTLGKIEQYSAKLTEQKEFMLAHPSYQWDPETVKNNTERIQNKVKELDNQIAQSQEAGTTEYTKQLKEKKKKLKQELDEMSANIDPEVQAQRRLLEDELAAYAPDLIKEQSKGFSRSDSWLRDNQQFGKEWMWVDNSTLTQMEEAMNVLSHAATPEELEKAPWGQHFMELQKGLEEGKHYAIHKGAFEYIKRYSRATKVQDGNQIWAALQRYVVAPFKRLSVFSVGFHVRNLMTNYANAYLAGFNPFDLHNEMSAVAGELKIFEEITGHLDRLLATGNWRTADEQAELIRMLLDRGVKYTDINTKATIDIAFNPDYRRVFDEYLDMAARGVIGNNMFSRDLIQMMGKLRDQAFGRYSQMNLLELKSSTKLVGEKIRSITEKSFQLSKRMDDQAKVAMYRLAKSEKYRHLAAEMGFGDDIEKAAEKYVKFVLFDYNNLTRTEENVMKTLFPFYTWARKNLEFQLKNFFGAKGSRTKRYKIFSDALQGWKQGMANEEEYPDYADNYIPIWNDGGTITFIKFNTPWSDVDNILQGDGIVNMLSPLIKTPLEMITGYDFFTHKEFNTHGVMPGFGLGLNSLTRTFDIATKAIFQNYAPTWEDKKLAGAIGKKILDAVELAKHVFSFGSSVRDDGLVSSLGALLPSVFTSSNIQQTLYFNAKERQEQLRKAMSYYLDFEK